jgi:hypothetical protein
MTKQLQITAEEYLEISRTEAEKALNLVLEKFDFERAAKALSACDWKYSGASASPSADELRTLARKIVMDVIQSGSGSSIQAGPLMVEARHYETPAVVTLTLRLVPVYGSAVYIDGRVIMAKKQVRFKSKKTEAVTAQQG